MGLVDFGVGVRDVLRLRDTLFLGVGVRAKRWKLELGVIGRDSRVYAFFSFSVNLLANEKP